ncbi:MAG: exonuclease domain-containing protein [Sarcina sp.]
MFSNKELLQERINELDNAILNYKDDKINIFSFATKERMLDCFINSNFCFASQGVYEKNDIDFKCIKSSANFITTNISGEIKLITLEKESIFASKGDAINFINTTSSSNLPEEIVEIINEDITPYENFEDISTDIMTNVEYSEEVLEDSNISDVLDELYTAIDYDRILAIDFETANEFHDKACSIGIAIYENGEINLSKEFLINPETYFNKTNISIHGITEDMVKDAPTFPTVWKNIFDMIDSRTLVIAHNAAFDIRLLQKLVAIYKCEFKDFDYLCTQNLYRSNVKLDAYNLKAVGTHIGESFEHHKAVDDSLICLKAFLNVVNIPRLFNRNLIENELRTTVSRFTMTDENKRYTARVKRQSFNKFSTSNFKAKDLKPKSTNFDENHPVFEKVFTFTGDFTNFASKEEAAQRIVDLGGTFKDGLVKANDYLVQGINLNTGLPMEGSKVQKVADYNNKGCNIQIITEFELMNLLSVKSATEKVEEHNQIIEKVDVIIATPTEDVAMIEEISNIDNSTKQVKDAPTENLGNLILDLEDTITNSRDSEILIEISKPIEPPILEDVKEETQDNIVIDTPKEEVSATKPKFKPRGSDTQLSIFDLMMGGSPSEETQEVTTTETLDAEISKPEVTTTTSLSNDLTNVATETSKSEIQTEARTYSLIAPKNDFIMFETESEKLEKLKQYKLISAKATACDKAIYYKGVYSSDAIRCDIVGYLDLDVLILDINGKLHSIRGEYLKQMQDANFSIFET